MNEHLQALGAFFLVLLASILSQRAEAAAVLSPVVSGYSAGSFSAASGSFTTAANAASYGASGVVNVGGKPITVPATLRMASNAGQYVKNALRLNPWAIAGTLALPWLLSEGMEWVEGLGWQKQGVSVGDWYDVCPYDASQGCIDYGDQLAVGEGQKDACRSTYGINSYKYFSDAAMPSRWHAYCATGSAAVPLREAEQSDWDALPDPLPVLAPEVPYAPYIEGAPVEAPEYDFAPFSVPVGDPYTKPDGSTAQPMAKVSPNGDKVTVDTYDQPLTDTNGDPVPNPQPQDTPEPVPNHCEQNPNSIGCAQFGDIPAPDVLPETQIPASTTVVPIGGPGVCPASITTTKFGLTWSYQPICDFAEAVKPFILGFAWLGFAYIVAGTVRT